MHGREIASSAGSQHHAPMPPLSAGPRFAQVWDERGRGWKQEWNLIIAEALDDIGQPFWACSSSATGTRSATRGAR